MEITTGTTETGGAPEGGGEGAPDLSGLMSSFQTGLEGLTQRIDALGQRIPEPTPAAAEETPPPEGPGELPEWTDEDFDERGELTLEAQTRAIQQIAESVYEARRAPELAREAESRRDARADEIEEQYPDLADPEKQDHYIALAAQRAEALGRPDLAVEPDWLEVVYLAEQAKEARGRETPADAEREVLIERGGNAGPAPGATAGKDDGDRIVALAKRTHYRLGNK